MSKKIKITPEFLEEVRKGVENSGSRLQYATMVDVAHTTVRDWLEGKADHVRADVYSRVLDISNSLATKKYMGQVLRCVRKKRGFSAEEIAALYGIHEQLIYAYEQGKYFPKTKNLQILCKALRIDPLIIFMYSQTPPKSDFFSVANQIIRESDEKRKEESNKNMDPFPAVPEEPADPEDPEDRLLVDAVRQGAKNLSSTEKQILLRTIVLFTTQKTHKEFYKCEK